MTESFIKLLLTEWYELQDYWVRGSVPVAKYLTGSVVSKLDFVAFDPTRASVVHIEVCMGGWNQSGLQCKCAFEAGRKVLPQLFSADQMSVRIEQIALFPSDYFIEQPELAGGRVLCVRELMTEVHSRIAGSSLHPESIPERFPCLRTLQFAAKYWNDSPGRVGLAGAFK